jgi:hypothetical protein
MDDPEARHRPHRNWDNATAPSLLTPVDFGIRVRRFRGTGGVGRWSSGNQEGIKEVRHRQEG